MKSKRVGLKRVMDATRYSWQGLVAAYRFESSFRLELYIAIVLLPVAFWVEASINERVALIASMLLVMLVELLNSAIEATLDRIGEEHNELTGRAKDLGSAAVFFAYLIAGMVWGGVILF